MTKKQLADLCRFQIAENEPKEPISNESKEFFYAERADILRNFSDEEIIDIWLNTCGCGNTIIENENKLNKLIQKSRSVNHFQYLKRIEVNRMCERGEGHQHLLN